MSALEFVDSFVVVVLGFCFAMQRQRMSWSQCFKLPPTKRNLTVYDQWSANTNLQVNLESESVDICQRMSCSHSASSSPPLKKLDRTAIQWSANSNLGVNLESESVDVGSANVMWLQFFKFPQPKNLTECDQIVRQQQLGREKA